MSWMICKYKGEHGNGLCEYAGWTSKHGLTCLYVPGGGPLKKIIRLKELTACPAGPGGPKPEGMDEDKEAA